MERVSSQALPDNEDPLGRDSDSLQPLRRLSSEKIIDESRDLESDNESTLDEVESDFLSGITHMTVLEDELKEVRLNLAKAKSRGKYIPLRLYRSGKWNSISVTDIQAGLWCEVQLEYRYLHPHMRTTVEWQNMKKKGKPVQLKTPTMMHGETIHLKKELEVHEIVRVKTVSREDKWAVDLVTTFRQLETIKTGALEREICTFGEPFDNDILVKGIIDQVQFSDGELTILDFKTRKTCTLPSVAQKEGHSLQLMLYKQMLDSMTCGATDMKVLTKHLKLNFDLALSDTVLEHVEKCGLLSSFGNSVQKSVTNKRQRLTYPTVTFGALVGIISDRIVHLRLPLVSNLLIQYEHQGTGTVIGVESLSYNEDWMKKVIKHSLAFWRGHRPASGVDIEDLWKCNHCQFSDICVWRMRKVLETSPAARQTLPTVSSCEN